MPANRMNREEFFAKVSPLEAEQLRKVLWTLYWRGTMQVRERIEEALTPEAEPKRKVKDMPAPDEVLAEVTEFVSLARAGAYMYGDRRVTRTQRSKWRLTFRSLATQAQSALHAADTGPAEQAVELLIDLACEMRGSDYFHSDDPVEAARFVVSHAVAALWQTVLSQHGFAVFAGRAASGLIRWESEYGWTRGDGKVAENEKLLADVLEPMLTCARCTACAPSYPKPRHCTRSDGNRSTPEPWSHGTTGRQVPTAAVASSASHRKCRDGSLKEPTSRP